MKIEKNYLSTNVLEESKNRISFIFDTVEKIYVSFSGGKDSTVMLHLVMEEAIKRNKKVAVIFVDWECQFTLTIDHVRLMFELYKEYIIPYWISLPLRTVNGTSQLEPEWTCWEESKKNIWVRNKEPNSIQDISYFPFWFENMTFEEFMPLFGEWFADGNITANFIGIRTHESLDRWRAINNVKKQTIQNKLFTTKSTKHVYNVYPIYDWSVEDDWIYISKYKKLYNPLYDRMYESGMTLHQMRIDEPFGETQRISLWLYHVVEPQLWAKMLLRVSGSNSGALYSKDSGNIFGNQNITLPKNHTWESFCNLLLDTMPPQHAEHYKNKIAVSINFWKKKGYEKIPDEKEKIKGIPDSDHPSWKVFCKCLLRNDYWCKSLGFAPTKSQSYKKYLDLMQRRRTKWGIYNEF